MIETKNSEELTFEWLPEGECAIVELMGHSTMIGRITE